MEDKICEIVVDGLIRFHGSYMLVVSGAIRKRGQVNLDKHIKKRYVEINFTNM